ncbi:MAG: hypothetical protein KJT03_18405 [Verrucomicrobiae bacterium]|nr:hypothetical protein [Verrucomicrobiae bacterium]
MFSFDHFIPIPEKFWSFETGKPFETCSLCGTELLQSGANYLVEKAFKKTEVIFEYAICRDCRMKVMNELSRKSLKLIDHYFSEHVDEEARLEKLWKESPRSADGWISHCLVKGTPVEELEEYQVGGLFTGDNMVLADFPFALGGVAIDEIIHLLSDETLGALNDFSDKVFGIDLPNKFLIL